MDRTIKITNARVADSGQWICIARNSAGESRKTFDLSVLGERHSRLSSTPHISNDAFAESPQFLDPSSTNSSIVIGRPLLLDCSVSGTPKPTLVWMKVSRRGKGRGL